MVGDGSSDGRRGTRPVLADVTNRQGKRRFLAISGSPVLDRGNGFRDNLGGKLADSKFVQKICPGVENLVRGKYNSDSFEDGNGKGLPLAKPMGLCSSLKSGSGCESLNGDKGSGISEVHGEIKDLQTVLDGGMAYIRENAVTRRILEKSDGSRDCYMSGVRSSEHCNESGNSQSVIVGGSQGDKEHVKADVGRDATGSILENDAVDAYVCGHGGDLTSAKSNLAGLSSSKFPEPGLFASSGNADRSDGNHGVDMLNDCSCSFCLKASYIWSDLHYKDVKGQIAALKNSQGEVKFCVDRSLNQYETEKNGVANSNKSKELELDLMGKWNSLFLNTEDILIRESNQLQSSLLSLKELRGSCKMQLEKTTVMPLNK